MANEKQQLSEMLKQTSQPEQSMGLIEAAKEGIQAIAPGLSLSNILSDIGSELGRLGVQGQMEMASALFSNGNAFVPYGPGSYAPTPEHAPDHGLPIEAMKQPEVEQSHGGLGM